MMKKLLQRQLKDLPEDQRTILMQAIEEDPEFFEKLAKEIKAAMDSGSNQMAATMKVLKKPEYQNKLKALFSGVAQQQPRG